MSLEDHESVDALKRNFKNKFKLNFRILFALLIMQILLSLSLCYLIKSHKTYVFFKYIECKAKSAILPNLMLIKHVIIFEKPDGSKVKTRTHVILNNDDVLDSYFEVRNFLIILLALTSPIFLSKKYILKKIATLSNKKYGDKYIRGARLTDCKEYIKTIKNDVSDLMLSNIPLSKKAKNRHYIFLGKTGAGKSQSCMQLVEQLIDKNNRCIIHDPKMEYVQSFYDSDKDIIFNPVDSRSVNWNIFNEIKSIMDIDAISTSLIPNTEGKDKFWNDGARTIFAGILNIIYPDKEARNSKSIFDYLTLDASELVERFSATEGSKSAYRFLHTDTEHESVAKTADSLLATLIQYTKCFELMSRLEDNVGDDFSISNWIKQGKGTIFITNHASVKDTLKPILSLFIDLMGKKLLSLNDDPNRNIYFVLDEFGSLQKLPTIIDILTKARSKGASTILGVQDFGQIDNIYGKPLRQSIINSCSNKIFFSVEDNETAKIISDIIGEREFYRTNNTINADKKASSLSTNVRKGKLFLPSEIQELPALSGIVKLYESDYIKTKWDYKDFDKKNDAFIVHESMQLQSS